jgi:hypothetical protein
MLLSSKGKIALAVIRKIRVLTCYIEDGDYNARGNGGKASTFVAVKPRKLKLITGLRLRRQDQEANFWKKKNDLQQVAEQRGLYIFSPGFPCHSSFPHCSLLPHIGLWGVWKPWAGSTLSYPRFLKLAASSTARHRVRESVSNNAISSAGFVAANGSMIMDSKGSASDIIRRTIPAVLCREWVKTYKPQSGQSSLHTEFGTGDLASEKKS